MNRQQLGKVEFTEELLNHILDEIKDYAAFMVDAEGQIVTWSTGVKRLLGFDEDEFIGRNFSLIFSQEDIATDVPIHELERGLLIGVAKDERWYRRKDASKLWASGSLTRIEKEGKIVGAIKVIKDQSEAKLLEEERLRHLQSLAKATKELSQFAEVLSKGTKSPLQKMCSLVSTLKNGGIADPEALDSIELIESSTESVMNLVNDVLSYTKLETKKASSSFIDADELIHKILLDLENLIDENNVKVIVGPIPELLGNETNIERVLKNLVDNAIKHSCSESRSRIEIFSEEDNDKVTIAVRDYGSGISPKDQERIFNLFERGETKAEGKGLGLAVSKKLVNEWGGRLWVESEPRHGSTFYFTVPSRPVLAGYAEKRVDSSSEEIRA